MAQHVVLVSVHHRGFYSYNIVKLRMDIDRNLLVFYNHSSLSKPAADITQSTFNNNFVMPVAARVTLSRLIYFYFLSFSLPLHPTLFI